MPPPASAEELIARVRRSGLIPSAELDGAIRTFPADIDPPAVLERLVAERFLTQFQADRLAAGKYKGFLLGNHVILDKIGSGGMGQVFLAEHASMRRLAAVKVLPAVDDPVAKERFHREARAAAALNHPNIVKVFDLNRDGRILYLVMEFVEGVSLQALVSKGGPLSPGAAAECARQAALGLQHAHEKGLVHRDIKPANLLIDRTGVVKLLDLGLVRATDDTSSQLTSSGRGGQAILGTVDYLAPEQAVDSSNVDIRADIYSLGATLYFLLAGHPIFPDGRTAQKLMWQQWRDPKPIREIRPDVPEGLAAIVHRAIHKQPADRYAEPQEMAEFLAEFSAGVTPPDPSLIPVVPPRRAVKPGGPVILDGPRLSSGLVSSHVVGVPGARPGPPPNRPIVPASIDLGQDSTSRGAASFGNGLSGDGSGSRNRSSSVWELPEPSPKTVVDSNGPRTPIPDDTPTIGPASAESRNGYRPVSSADLILPPAPAAPATTPFPEFSPRLEPPPAAPIPPAQFTLMAVIVAAAVAALVAGGLVAVVLVLVLK